MGKVRAKDKSELWKEGITSIDEYIEESRDDLINKGWDNESDIRSVLNLERSNMVDELSRNVNGDFTHPYEPGQYVDLNNIEYPDAVKSPQEQASLEGEYSDDIVDGISADELSTNEHMNVSIPDDESPKDLQSENNEMSNGYGNEVDNINKTGEGEESTEDQSYSY